MHARGFLHSTARPLAPQAQDCVRVKRLRLFKNEVADSVEMCAACLSDGPKIAEPPAISCPPSGHSDATMRR